MADMDSVAGDPLAGLGVDRLARMGQRNREVTDVPGEADGFFARAKSHVRSLARGIMERQAKQRAGQAPKKRGPRSQEQVNEERAAEFLETRQAETRRKRALQTKDDDAARHAASGKHVRGGKNKADKAGKVGINKLHAGRVAAAAGARKGTQNGRKKQHGAGVHTQSRGDVRGNPSGVKSHGQGRGMQAGARGKSGAKQRPSPRKGTK